MLNSSQSSHESGAGWGIDPQKLEWEASDAAYSYTTYKQRFGGWVNACASLVSGTDDIALPAVHSTYPGNR